MSYTKENKKKKLCNPNTDFEFRVELPYSQSKPNTTHVYAGMTTVYFKHQS